MSPFEFMMMPIQRYAQFSGRSRRMEYWMFAVGLIGVSIVISIVETMLGLAGMVGGAIGPISALFTLATLIPSIACAVRRLHDQDKSGWWLLLAFVPVLGALVLLVFMFLPGTSGDNQYGADPKAV